MHAALNLRAEAPAATPLWTADPRAMELIADCATNLPEVASRIGEGLVHRETWAAYTNRDPRVKELRRIWFAYTDESPEAYFGQPTVEQAIDAVRECGL